MSVWAEKTLSGWGRFPMATALCSRPEQVASAVDAVGGEPLIAHGLGRSYGDAAQLDNGRVLLTTRLDRMLDFDKETGVLKCEAGVSLKSIIETFLPRGWFPPVVPGTQFVTVGGAIGCNIHGKNHHVAGAFGDHVRSMEVLTSRGEIVTCSREHNDDLFGATIGGMGLTGIILSAELELYRVANASIEMETVRFDNLDEFFEVSAASADFTHTVAWIDCVKEGAQMGRGIFMRGRHASEGVEATPGVVDHFAEVASRFVDGRPFEANVWLNRATVSLFNEAYFRKTPAGITKSIVDYRPFFFPLDSVSNWNYIYGSRGFLQYQMVVPDRDAVREILKIISSSGFASFLAVVKEFGDHDHGGLSFPTAGTTLALDFPNVGARLFKTMDRLDDIVIDCGGRVYLGKDARLDKDSFRSMYPEWQEWKAVRDAWDPDHRFQSDLGRRLGLSGD